MAKKQTIFACQLSPYPHIGQIVRAADLCDGVITEGDITLVTITWKKSVKITKERKERAKTALKTAFEEKGYDCYSIKERNFNPT